MHGIYLNKGTTESPELVKVGVFNGMVFQDAVTFFKALIWLGPPDVFRIFDGPKFMHDSLHLFQSRSWDQFCHFEVLLDFKAKRNKSNLIASTTYNPHPWQDKNEI